MTYDEFAAAVDEETRQLPPYVFEELYGGVLVDPGAYLHPDRLADDLYILGTFSRGIYGSQIILYYGSFQASAGFTDDETMRRMIRDTLRHEFRHHLETRAGMFGKDSLIREDRERMRAYQERHLAV